MSSFDEDSIEKLYEEHLNIIKAIEKHGSEEASKFMDLHLDQINRGRLAE